MVRLFNVDIDEFIELADEKWDKWFGEYSNEGILNFECYNDRITLAKCMNNGQDFAPIYNNSIYSNKKYV